MKKVYLLLWSLVFFVASCSDETTVFNDPQDGFQLEKSDQILENSVRIDYAGVLDIADEATLSGKYSKTSKDAPAGDYPLTLVAQIDPPSFNGGTNLTASHVHLDGNYAYVSYNTVEDGYAGGIDIIDVRNPTKPRVSSRLYYSNADINAIEYNDGYIYAVGGVDAEKSVRATSNSFLAKIPASGGRMNIGAGIEYAFQEGFNSTDVEVTSSTVIVSSGGDGTITVYKKSDLSVENEATFADLRSVSLNNNQFAILDASKGVSILDNNLNVIKDIPINTDFGTATKRTIDYKNEMILVSEGSKGAGLYNAISGALIEYIPILLDSSSDSSSDKVTNAVAMNEEVILMANGGAGLCLSEDETNSTKLVGVIQLDGSINYVESNGDYIFAASGKKGLQIIKLNRPDASLANRCSSLPAYTGSSKLTVNQGQTKEYRGSKRFNRITVNGSLLLCGSWTVRNSSYINTNGVFEMNGTLVIGRNNKRKNITVSDNGTFRVEGNLTIYGDLILNDGATLEFIGDSSKVTVFGSVKRSGNITITGDFEDVRDKF